MKRYLTHVLLTCLLVSSAFCAQPSTREVPSEKATPAPEQILSRAVQAIGGRKELNKLQSFQLHGVMRLSDERPVVEIDLATHSGGKVLGTMTYIGVGQSRFGSDGTTAWEQNLGANDEISWEIIDTASLSQKVQQMNWLEWFTMLPTQLQHMKVIGTEEFDGELCWKVQIEKVNEKGQIAFFSTQTHRPKGRRTVERTNKEDVTVDVFFRDWERTDDLLLFHTIVFSRDNTTIILKLDSIVLNKAREDLFVLPKEIVELRDKE